MNLIKMVYGSLRWKKSDEFCASKIGVSLEKYQDIKRQILDIKSTLQDELEESMVDIVGKRMLDLIDDEAIKTEYIANLEDHLIEAINQKKEKVIEFKEDLDQGSAEIKGVAFSEPKSPEEIIRILKIDTNKWKLSSYWNKQHKDYWLVSAMVTQKQVNFADLLAKTLETFNPETPDFDVLTI